MTSPTEIFWSPHYVRHNRRRLAHVASLELGLAGRTVLEVGAGIGDHTRFLLAQGCDVIASEAQEDNLAVLRERFPELDIRRIDLNEPPEPIAADVVYCYGTLYHLHMPAEAIAWMSRCAREMLLLETCVAYGDEPALYPLRNPRARNMHSRGTVAGPPARGLCRHSRRASRTSTARSLSPCTRSSLSIGAERSSRAIH